MKATLPTYKNWRHQEEQDRTSLQQYLGLAAPEEDARNHSGQLRNHLLIAKSLHKPFR